jgi:MarR family transcriptional regulator, lower aerobic nicotinate degradation pathway regulator
MSQNPSATPSNLSITDSLVQLSYHIQAILGRVGDEHGLSPIQIRLLGILRDREPGMQQLARYLNLDKSSITGLVDRAERRGLVERTAAPNDRRGFHVRLTSAGQQLVRDAGAGIEHQLQAAVETITESERSQLTSLIGKILGISASPNG